MKTGFIIVLYHTPQHEIERLKNEISHLGFIDYKIYWMDNSKDNKGYAAAINEGLRKGVSDDIELFVILNPDISFGSLNKKIITAPSKYFGMWSFAMHQNNLQYFGGKVDKWRMSGILNKIKPKQQFYETEYISGSMMVLKRSTFDTVGYFDESYFMYYEDTDYSRRCIQKNIKIGIDSVHSFIHFEKSDSYDQKKYWLAKSRVRFFLKFASFKQFVREILRLPKTIWEEKIVIRDFFVKSLFLKNFLSLNLSSFLSKALNFILFFVLIRHLTVAEYGIYTLVWAHVTLLSPLVDFGTTSYGMIYLAKSKSYQISSLFSLRFGLSLIVFFITILLSFIFKYEGKIIIYICFTSFVILFNFSSGTYFIITSVLQKLTKTALISFVLNTLLILLLILGVIYLKKIRFIFIILGFCYIIFSLLYIHLIKRLVPLLHVKIELRNWYLILKKSYIFIFISLFAGIYFKIDVLLLSFFKGKDAVGVYSSGYKFLEALIIIASSYNAVSMSLFSQISRTNKSLLLIKVKRHLMLLVLIGGTVVLGTYLLGPHVFPLILKGNYLLSIPVINIIIWALPIILFNSIFLNVLYASHLSKYVIFLFIGLSIINILLNIIFIPHYSYVASSYITVFCELVSLFVLSYLVLIRFKTKIFYD